MFISRRKFEKMLDLTREEVYGLRRDNQLEFNAIKERHKQELVDLWRVEKKKKKRLDFVQDKLKIYPPYVAEKEED